MISPSAAEGPADDATAAEFKGLTRYYGPVRGVEGLDLRVHQGEILGLLGPNGAGKTTTMRLLLGLLRPSEGRVELFGSDLRNALPGVLARVGYLPGDFGLYGDLTGREYLRHLLRLRSPRHGNPSRMDELMTRFPIAFDRRIRTYSKGMRQVIGIIQAFAHAPDLVVLDEPTSGLDPLNQAAFYDLLVEERSAGTAIFLSSHVLSEVQRVCDRVAVLSDGRLVREAGVKDHRRRVGKRIQLLIGDPPPSIAQALSKLQGVRDLAATPDGLEFRYTGALRPLLLHLAELPIDDLVCSEPTIEDVFMEALGT